MFLLRAQKNRFFVHKTAYMHKKSCFLYSKANTINWKQKFKFLFYRQKFK